MTTPKLKVYGWTNPHRAECPPAPNGSRETREVVAATSKAEARRLGSKIPLSEINQAGALTEINLAMASPGVVFWRPATRHGSRMVRAGDPWPEAPVFRSTGNGGSGTEARLHGVRLSASWASGGHIALATIGNAPHAEEGMGRRMTREAAEKRSVELALGLVKAEIARLQRAQAWLEGRGEPPPEEAR